MTIIAVGIDLAKHVFAVHGVEGPGRAARVRPSVARDKLQEMIATLLPCLIGRRACTGAHHWARGQKDQIAAVLVRGIDDRFIGYPARFAGGVVLDAVLPGQGRAFLQNFRSHGLCSPAHRV